MSRSTARLDACVLVPIALADTLLRVAEKGLYRPLWSDRILAEAQAATEEIHPGMDAGKRFTQMREAFDDALVTGWEELEPGIRLPDPDDRHVLAAAIRGGADAIITANVKDFPAAALEPLGLEAVRPDDFLLDQLDLSPPTILQVIRDQAARTRRPPLTPRDLATLLGRAGVPGFADEILRLMASPLDGGTT
jgi:predicted nucleic acid-binding protein